MKLNVDYIELRNVAVQVLQKGNELQYNLNTIKSINLELQSYWEGADATKYFSSVDSQVENVQKLIDLINSIGNFLEAIANSYEELTIENARAIID